MKILVVEDDSLTAEALASTLANQNYTVEFAADGETGWELVEAFAYDLILLDVTLPKLDGISLCQRLRSHNYQMPILLLTASNNSHDKAVGLDAGADDYVVKPFDPEELAARIRALWRRDRATVQSVLQWGDLRLDPSSCEATYGEQSLSLTAKEFALLELFLRNSRRVFSCGAILENLWSFETIPSDEAVRTHIKGLRQKLKAVNAPTDLIQTVYGIGYRLKPLEEKPGKRKQAKQQSANKSQTVSDSAGKIGAEHPLLLIVDSDRALAVAIAAEAAHWGWRAEVATNLAIARDIIERQHPTAILLDIAVSESITDSLNLLAELHQQMPSVSVLILTDREQLQYRLKVARLGGSAFLHKPLPPAEILKEITRILHQTDPVDARIMVVGDDPQLLATVRRLLQPWGMHITTLSNPNRFWETLAASEPDLLIIDIQMPDISGIELCQVVRNDVHWSGLPIVILTADSDAKTVNQIFAAGADDFISKPIVGPELVTRTINRLERIKWLRNMVTMHQSESAKKQLMANS